MHLCRYCGESDLKSFLSRVYNLGTGEQKEKSDSFGRGNKSFWSGSEVFVVVMHRCPVFFQVSFNLGTQV